MAGLATDAPDRVTVWHLTSQHAVGPFFRGASPQLILFFLPVRPIYRRMTPTLSLRRASPADLSAVDALLARSYPRLLAADYPPSTMVLAVPRIARARPELLACGTYFLAEDPSGRILAAGGWTRIPPTGAGGIELTGHVRHVATDPDFARRGIGRALMGRVMRDARDAGMEWLDCLSTRTAVPFYASQGFRPLHMVEVPLAPGIVFPAVRMLVDLRRIAA
jgi:GNAT superfamily N-acetyltransferase